MASYCFDFEFACRDTGVIYYMLGPWRSYRGCAALDMVLGIELKSLGLIANIYPLCHLSGPPFFLGAVVFD